jgi:hypothetical protein
VTDGSEERVSSSGRPNAVGETAEEGAAVAVLALRLASIAVAVAIVVAAVVAIVMAAVVAVVAVVAVAVLVTVEVALAGAIRFLASAATDSRPLLGRPENHLRILSSFEHRASGTSYAE